MESRATFVKKFSSAYAKPSRKILSPSCAKPLREKRFGISFKSPNPRTIRSSIGCLAQDFYPENHSRWRPRMIRRSWLAQINFHSQSPRIRMSWLTQLKFQRQSPRTRMSWLAQQRNFWWQRDNSQSPRSIRIPHLAPQNFQPKDTIRNSAKIWIESFVVGRISWWGGQGTRGDGIGFWWFEVVAGDVNFSQHWILFLYYPVMSHTYIHGSPARTWVVD